jgi:hypothetical protein
VLVEVVQELSGTPGSVLRLGLAVVPGDAARLALDLGSGHVGGDTAEEPLDGTEPAQVEIRERMPLAAEWPGEVAVLGGEVNGQAGEPALENPPAAPAHDVDVGVRQASELPQERADLRRGLGEIGVTLEQRAVVVEEDRPAAGAREPALEPLGLGLVDRPWAANPLAT